MGSFACHRLEPRHYDFELSTYKKKSPYHGPSVPVPAMLHPSKLLATTTTERPTMLAGSIILLALAATGLAQAPEGYRTVYMTSMVDTQYVIVPIAAEAGSGLVVCVGLVARNKFHVANHRFSETQANPQRHTRAAVVHSSGYHTHTTGRDHVLHGRRCRK